MEGKKLGEHWILELVGCPEALLDDLDFVKESETEACRLAKAKFLNIATHKFEPQGVTAVVLLAESHLSIHTWPEEGYAGIDIFTCADHLTPGRACEYLIERFQPSSHSTAVIERGTNVPTHPNRL